VIILNALSTPPSNIKAAAVTIGNFDGIHLGHQALFKSLHLSSKKLHGHSVAITFQQHPSQLFKPDIPIQNLITQRHKLQLLQTEQIDLLYNIPFTQEFSRQSADQFLTHLHSLLNFQELILGHDAVIGRERHGDKETILKIAESLGFTVTYIPPVKIGDTTVSSSQIRHKLVKGDFDAVKDLLGRPYSIRSIVERGNSVGRTIGFPTANIDVKGLCLPPLGVYAVTVEHPQGKTLGMANLGVAPTVRTNNVPLLEVHLLNSQLDLY
jgi:riboflavin kinase/FMN adenylyltransferase